MAQWFGYTGQATTTLTKASITSRYDACPCPIDGRITKFKTYFQNAQGTVKLQVFRYVSGSTYKLIGQSQVVTAENGLKEYTLDTPIEVLAGDLIGICKSDLNTIKVRYSNSGFLHYKSSCPTVIGDNYAFTFMVGSTRLSVQAYVEEPPPIEKALYETVSLTLSLSKVPKKVCEETVSLVPSFSRIYHGKRTFKEILNISPFPKFSPIKPLSEKLRLKEERFSLLQKELKEIVSLIAKLFKGFSKSLKETLTLKDSFEYAIFKAILRLYESLHLKGEITNPKFLYLYESLRLAERKVFYDFPFWKRYKLVLRLLLRKTIVQFYKRKSGVRICSEETYKVKVRTQND